MNSALYSNKLVCLLLLLGLLALSGCTSTPIVTDQGIPWELAEHRRETISDLRYRFALDIPISSTEAIKGKSRITFNWTDPSAQPLVIDFLKPLQRVRSVLVNGIEASWQPVNDHIVIPASALRAGDNSIVLAFDAGDDAFNRRENFLYTLFVPDRAHFSLPLFDQPNLKGRVTWEVTVPEQWKVVANGPEASARTQNGRTHFTFLETHPIPSYLFALAAGVFERETAEVNGRTFSMYHRETDTDKVARNSDEIFRLHAAALDWLEDYTQIDYPFQKFDFVLIPSFQYGGMEHPGGILYRQASIFLDETATQNQMLGRASVIAHETAHMWFGDLVTMNWFDDVWTKEVFANFMAAKIVSPSFPEVDHELRFLTAHHPSAYSIDRTAGANPIRQPLENLRFAGTLYGAIIYQKAPVVMRHLENRVGEEVFREGMREYLSTYAYGNATWLDLIAILDARSEQDLATWSQVWVEESNRPLINIFREGGDVIVQQQDPENRGRMWPQTLEMRIGSIQESKTLTIELGFEPQRLSGLAKAEFILPNGSGVEYGEFILDTQSQAYLVSNVNQLDTALLRGATWVTLWDQLLAERLAPSLFLKTALDSLAIEQDQLVVSQILSYTQTVYWNYLSNSERKRLIPAIEKLLWTQVMGERSRSGRSSFYSAYRGLASTDEGLARLQRLWSGDEQVAGLPLSELDQISLASQLAIKGMVNAEDILWQQQQRIENPDRLARFKFVRDSLSANPAVRNAFFESLKLESNRDHEAWVIAGLNNIHHPLRAQESIKLIEPALRMIGDIQATGDIFFPGRWLDSTLGGHNSVAAAETIHKFLESTPNLSPRLRLKVQQSADGVFRAAYLVNGWNTD